MRSSSRKCSTDAELHTLALTALTRRAHSVHEMRVYLERHAEDKDTAKCVLERLLQQKLLDDARYARQFVRIHSEIRRQGRFRIARDLRARGVSDKHIESALEELAAETDEGEMVRARIARRLKSLRGPLDDRRRASIYRSLLRAGFSSEIIRREFLSTAKISLDDSLEISPVEE